MASPVLLGAEQEQGSSTPVVDSAAGSEQQQISADCRTRDPEALCQQ
jgi:hypothetical protein